MFDQDLDDTLGYYDFSDDQFEASLRAFAPNLPGYDVSENQDATLATPPI